jgi:hypothetical protein
MNGTLAFLAQKEPRAHISGSIEQLSLPELLQTCEAGRRSGRILLRRQHLRATVWLRGGRIVDAEIEGGSRGAEAVYELALWDEGTFQADFTPVPVVERIFEPTTALLLEAMRRRDEELRSVNPPHAAIPDPPPPPPRPLLALHRSLTLLNVASAYAVGFVEPLLAARRLEEARRDLAAEHPALDRFRVSDGGAVSATPGAVPWIGSEALVRAVSLWLIRFFSAMERAVPGRFPLSRLRSVTEAVQDDLGTLGFYRELGFEPGPGSR